MENQTPEIVNNSSLQNDDLQLMLNAGISFLTQLPEIEQKKQDTIIKTKEIDKQMQLDAFTHTEKADKNDKKYSIVILLIILTVIFIFKKFDVVGSEKLDMVFLLLMSFIFTNSGKIWKTISKNTENTDE